MSLATLEAVATQSVVARVDLLPEGIDEARRFRRVQAGLGASLVVVVGIVALAWTIGAGHVQSAQDALDAEQSRTTQLQRQQAKYAQVPVVVKQLDAARAAQRAVSAFDVSWFGMLDAVALRTPPGTSIATMTMALDPTATAAGGSGVVAPTDPLGVPGVGSVAIVGTAPSQDAVASLLEGLAQVPGLAHPLVSSATAGESGAGVAYTTTTTITPGALLNQQ
jgi:Tfp pilus assembly protein PilN